MYYPIIIIIHVILLSMIGLEPGCSGAFPSRRAGRHGDNTNAATGGGFPVGKHML